MGRMTRIHTNYCYYQPIESNDNTPSVKYDWIGYTLDKTYVMPQGAPANEGVWIL